MAVLAGSSLTVSEKGTNPVVLPSFAFPNPDYPSHVYTCQFSRNSPFKFSTSTSENHQTPCNDPEDGRIYFFHYLCLEILFIQEHLQISDTTVLPQTASLNLSNVSTISECKSVTLKQKLIGFSGISLQSQKFPDNPAF